VWGVGEVFLRKPCGGPSGPLVPFRRLLSEQGRQWERGGLLVSRSQAAPRRSLLVAPGGTHSQPVAVSASEQVTSSMVSPMTRRLLWGQRVRRRVA
jgi:hypothetical protein